MNGESEQSVLRDIWVSSFPVWRTGMASDRSGMADGRRQARRWASWRAAASRVAALARPVPAPCSRPPLDLTDRRASPRGAQGGSHDILFHQSAASHHFVGMRLADPLATRIFGHVRSPPLAARHAAAAEPATPRLAAKCPSAAIKRTGLALTARCSLRAR